MDYRIAALALIVVASGCIGLGSQSPEKQMENLASKADSSTYHVDYTISIGGSDSLSGLIGDPAVYSYKGDTKTVVSTSMFGSSTVVASYEYGNRTVSCTESSGGILDSGGLECELDESQNAGSLPSGQTYEDKLEDLDVNVSGTKEVAGRECKMFTIYIPADTMNSTYYEGGAYADLCLDRQKGYTAYIALNTSQESELRGTTTQNVLTMKAKSYSADVSRSDVEVPVNAIMSVTCDPFEAEIMSISHTGSATISVNGQNQTVQLEEGETRTFSLDNQQTGNNEVVLYAGDSSTSGSCYNYDFSSDFNFSDY